MTGLLQFGAKPKPKPKLNSNDDILISSLSNFQKIKNLSNQEMSELLEIKPNHWSDQKKQNKSISIKALSLLCERYHLSLEKFFTTGHELLELDQHFNSQGELPERYRPHAFTYRASSMYMIEYIEKLYGHESLLYLERNLGLAHHLFSKAAEKNNMLLTLDICESLARFTGPSDVFFMGAHFYETWKESDLFSPLKKSHDVLELFECMIYELSPKSIEQNYFWSIEASAPGEFIVIKGIANNEVYDPLLNQYGNLLRLDLLEELRKGFIASLSRFLGLGMSTVTMLKSRAKGNPWDLFKVDFSNLSPQPLQFTGHKNGPSAHSWWSPLPLTHDYH